MGMSEFDPAARERRDWNAGRRVGAKRPLKPRQVWAVRFFLDQHRRLRDRALFDLTIDSKLRGCDIVKIKIGELTSGGHIRSRAIVVQQKTGRPVQFELMDDARASLLTWLERRGGMLTDYAFPSRIDHAAHLSTRQYARLVDEWVTGIGLRREEYGKRILLFGCGALGSAVAETVMRAGASAVALVDNGIVGFGLLGRQRYRAIDIGLAKAGVLKERLVDIGLPCTVEAHDHNLVNAALSLFTLGDWDLLIDATASARVGHRIERELVMQDLPIPLLTMSVSASASDGCVTVRMPGHAGGPQQIARQAKLEAFASDPKHPLTKAFWPERDEIAIFQPEPGCSAPTFIGSAADIDFHAAALLNLGLSRIGALDVTQASMDLIAAPWRERKRSASPHLRYAFDAYPRFAEQRHGYHVRQSEIARRSMAAEIGGSGVPARTRSRPAG